MIAALETPAVVWPLAENQEGTLLNRVIKRASGLGAATHLRSICSLAATGLVLGLVAVPAVAAVTPKAGTYTAKCSQGYLSICGEAGWIVASGGKRIAKNATVPWPNDPAKPSIGICGRSNPFVKTAIKIKSGKFTYHGTAGGQAFTWKGRWVTRTKLTGTVKWAGCATVAKYTAKRRTL